MLWIFAYGSLLFRPNIPFVERRPAVLQGFVRRFWQGSTDHRGVPGAPGRVVTLVREAGAKCHGIAYGVAEEDRALVLDRLDVREQGGYDRLSTTLRSPSGEVITDEGLVYIATIENPNWLGDAPIAEIAAQVARSKGPSGENRDYVLFLARALRELGVEDEHVFAIESELQKLLREG